MLKLVQTIAVVSLILLAPLAVSAADLAVPKENVYFSNTKPLAGEIVRIYATIKNQSQQDVRASVEFKVNQTQVGSVQPITVLSQKESTVFVDWGPLEGYYDIAVSVINPDAGDENSENNTAEITDFIVDLDTDKDGIFDTIDMDDDNDTVEDGLERVKGSNPLVADTDQDGAHDGIDAFPLDPNEKYDNDKDGIGNNADPDNDNDGVPNGDDPAPFDPNIKAAPAPSVPEPSGVDPSGILGTGSGGRDAGGQSGSAASGVEAAPQAEQEPDGAPEYKTEEVEYTFPDQSEADYTLDVSIAKSKIAWNRYQFEVLGADGSFLYLWDFGDGTYAQAMDAEHAFPGAGEYEVALSVSDGAGGLGLAAERISIGFWNLGNLAVKLLVGLLGLFSLFLIGYLVLQALPARAKRT
ncbi:MAG: PKD domain-containing protein [Parcubacteria group bacterium]|nr:PKD domain-containing protein [Parcubacteria group bacterium]